jgi:hypothetical protein
MPCASVGGLSPADHADCQPHAAADTGLGQNARHPDSGTPEPPPAGRRSTPAVFCAEPSPPPLAPGSRSFAAGAVCGCDHERCRGASTCRRSARSSRTVPLGPRQARRWPGSPPEPLASSSPACEDGSTCPNPAPNVPQNRSCHEKRRTPRVYVIIRDGTVRLERARTRDELFQCVTFITLNPHLEPAKRSRPIRAPRWDPSACPWPF